MPPGYNINDEKVNSTEVGRNDNGDDHYEKDNNRNNVNEI